MFKKELEVLKQQRFLLVVLVVLAFIPFLYNAIFLKSMWDPYGKVSDLPVAVVNLDKGATLDDKAIKIGDDLVEELQHNTAMHFNFVSEERANKGIKAGQYVMKVTLPEDLSAQAASLMTDQPKPLDIEYQTTKGYNFIASKMAESAMAKLKAQVSEKVTLSYTEQIFDKLKLLKTGMGEASQGSQQLVTANQTAQTGASNLANGVAQLASQTPQLNQGSQQLAEGLARYGQGVAQLSSGSATFNSKLSQYLDGSSQLEAASEQLAAKVGDLTQGAQSLTQGLDQLTSVSDGLRQLQAGLQDLANGTQLPATQADQIAQLQAGLPQLQAGIAQLAGQVSSGSSTNMTAIKADLGAIATGLTQMASAQSRVEATSAYKGLTPDQQAEIQQALAPSQDQAALMAIQDLESQLSALVGQQASLEQGVTQLATQADLALPGAVTVITQLKGGLDTTHQVLEGQLVPGIGKALTGLDTLSTGLTTGANQLQSGLTQYQAGVDDMATGVKRLTANNQALLSGGQTLSVGAQQLNSQLPTIQGGADKLAQATSQLQTGSTTLSAGADQLASGQLQLLSGTKKLSGALSSANQGLSVNKADIMNAKAISSPVKLHHTDQDNSETNGTGMAPYMIAVALFVGAISTNMIIGSSFSGAKATSMLDWLKSKGVINGGIALAQALLVDLAVHLLGLHANHEGRMLLLIMLTSFAFMALVTFFNTWLGKPGAFLMLVLLLLQLSSSAGTYPLALTDKFYQVISPWMPMTYAVSGLRQVISLTGQVAMQLSLLAVLAVIFFVLGGFVGGRKQKKA